MTFAGQAAWITGASSGIGAALAQVHLAAADFHRVQPLAGLKAARARGRKGGRPPLLATDIRVQTAKTILADKGFYPQNKLLGSKREQSRIEAEITATKTEIALNLARIDEARLQIRQIYQQRQEQIAENIAKQRGQNADDQADDDGPDDTHDTHDVSFVE